MKFEIEINEKDLADTICAGIEGGGIRYWAPTYHHECTEEQEQAARAKQAELDPDDKSRYWIYLLPFVGGSLVFDDGETDEQHTLTLEKLKLGVAHIIARHPRYVRELMDACEGDSCTGDILIQAAAIGEVRYG